MSTEELDALWLRLVSEGKARWMPGMRAHEYGVICPDCVLFGLGPPDNDVHCPDWTDPATLGALLGLVREAYGIKHLTHECLPIGWSIQDAVCGLDVCGAPTEAACLLRALEAAP